MAAKILQPFWHAPLSHNCHHRTASQGGYSLRSFGLRRWGGGQQGSGSAGRKRIGKKEERILVGLLREVTGVFCTIMDALGLPGLAGLCRPPGMHPASGLKWPRLEQQEGKLPKCPFSQISLPWEGGEVVIEVGISRRLGSGSSN